MSLIPLDLGGVKEPKAVPNGRYDLTISNAEEGVSKEAKKPMIIVYLGIDGHMDAPNLRHNISLPAEGDEPRTKEFKMLLLKRFLVLFEIPHDSSGFNLDDFIGSTANAEVRLTEPDANGNIYNELVLPRMKTEQEAASKVTGAARPPKR